MLCLDKWNDPEFRRIYNREYRRKNAGGVRHVNIMPDGSLWSDSHPFGRFETNRQRLDYINEQRRNQEPVTCDLCGVTYKPYAKQSHLKSKKHCDAQKCVQGT